MEQSREVSVALVAANTRLLALRRQQAATAAPTPTKQVAEQRQCVWAKLPAHLGWGSVALTAVCRRHQPNKPSRSSPPDSPLSPAPANEPPPTAAKTAVFLKLYPDIAHAILKQELTSPARLWLLLRHLDQTNQGWLSISMARQQVTHKQAPLRLCGWRQMRNLLRQGEGIFWQRDAKRIWLYGVGRVGRRLDVVRLGGKPVQLPLATLLAGIGMFRAHLFASYHSGRKQAAPISRQQLRRQSGVAPRTQRRYDRRAGVQGRRQVALGAPVSNVSWETMGWEQGRRIFKLWDKNGRFGPPQRSYIAWQLPNSYQGPHRQAARGRQRKVNQQLADLVQKGMRGNGRCQLIPRLYHRQAVTAVRHATPNQTRYWPARRRPAADYWYATG